MENQIPTQSTVVTPPPAPPIEPIKPNTPNLPKKATILEIILGILFLILFSVSGYFAYQNSKLQKEINTLKSAKTNPTPVATITVTPTPIPTSTPNSTCIPRPACLGDNPPCKVAESINECPPSPTPTQLPRQP